MKMNCKDTKTFIDEYWRMCHENRDLKDSCEDCPLMKAGVVDSFEKEGYNCEFGLIDNVERSIEIMQKWSDEHPKESIEEHFSKLLPYMGFDSYMSCCCRLLDGRIKTPDWCECCDYTEASCERCWSRPYEESMKGDK